VLAAGQQTRREVEKRDRTGLLLGEVQDLKKTAMYRESDTD